ncbi:hypothetical protein Hdeb2414_s0022g00616761 [Helianthus debilis subsp. tardiflorus]
MSRFNFIVLNHEPRLFITRMTSFHASLTASLHSTPSHTLSISPSPFCWMIDRQHSPPSSTGKTDHHHHHSPVVVQRRSKGDGDEREREREREKSESLE